MKLLLDEHHSPQVASELAKAGFEVLAASTWERSRHVRDEDLLAVAASEGRVVVTENVADFCPLASRWATEGRAHSGIVLTHPGKFNGARSSYPASLITALKAFLEGPSPVGGSWLWWL